MIASFSFCLWNSFVKLSWTIARLPLQNKLDGGSVIRRRHLHVVLQDGELSQSHTLPVALFNEPFGQHALWRSSAIVTHYGLCALETSCRWGSTKSSEENRRKPTCFCELQHTLTSKNCANRDSNSDLSLSIQALCRIVYFRPGHWLYVVQCIYLCIALTL